MLSVIVPIYQIKEYLSKCIESIQQQTYHDLEIILVDDGSTDGSGEICDKYAVRDSRIKVIHKVNGGLVSARIAGIKVATGEYVTYVDGDDWIDRDYYEGLIKKAEQYHVDIVMSGFTKNIDNVEIPNHNEMACGYYAKEDVERKLFPLMLYDDNSGIPGIFTYVWNKIFRLELLYRHQLSVDNSISIGEDAACVYPAILSAKSIFIDKSKGYHYRQRAGSMLKKYIGIEDEIPKLIALYESLWRCVNANIHAGSLLRSLMSFMKYMIASRTGGVFWYGGEFFSAYTEYVPPEVIIYGAGNIGQHLYSTLIDNSISNVKYWIDPDFVIYQKEGLHVVDSDVLQNYYGENVFVAFLKQTEIQEALNEIGKYHIPLSKIHVLDIKKISLHKILSMN